MEDGEEEAGWVALCEWWCGEGDGSSAGRSSIQRCRQGR